MTMRKSIAAGILFGASVLAMNTYAQAPVEDRAAAQKNQSQAQMKAEYARKERDAAAERVRAAEFELTEATRAQQNAEQALEEARRRALAARSSVEAARLQYQQADNRATQAAAAVGQNWPK